MLFADGETGTWVAVVGLAVTGVLGLFGTLAKLKNDTEMAVLKNNNASLRDDHEECHRRLSGLEAVHAADVILFDARLRKTEADGQEQRDMKHDLGNFVTVLFGDLYDAGVKPDKLEQRREQYLAIMTRSASRKTPPADGIGRREAV